MLERLARAKYYDLLDPFVNCEENGVLWTYPVAKDLSYEGFASQLVFCPASGPQISRYNLGLASVGNFLETDASYASYPNNS